MLQQNPVLAWILEYWTITIFLPAVLVLVSVLTFVTRRWDQRDESARKPRSTQSSAPAPASTVSTPLPVGLHWPGAADEPWRTYGLGSPGPDQPAFESGRRAASAAAARSFTDAA